MNSKYHKQLLANGIRLITVPIPQAKSVTAMVLVKVGSRYEEDRVAGISHFLEHMPFKGTKKYPTPLKLSSTVDSIGADFNAFTGKEHTGFYVKAGSQHLNLALDVLSQLIWEPLLPEKEMEKEKGVIIEEINMIEDTPMAKIAEEFETLIYGKTPLGREIIGYKETIRTMKQKDFWNYKNQWYRPERIVIGIVGGISNGTMKQWNNGTMELVEKYFSSKNFGKPNTLEKTEALNFSQRKPGLKMRYKKTEQAHFCLGVRALPRGHKDRYVLALLAIILGGNMSSRLFTEVREKRGLAYYVKTDIEAYFDNGYLVSQAGTDVSKASEAIKVTLEEYKKATSNKQQVTSQELKRAKEYLKGKLVLALEDSKEIASLYAETELLENKIRTPEEIIAGVEKVTVGDISRLAKQLFINQGLNLAIIGPYKDEEKFAKILKL